MRRKRWADTMIRETVNLTSHGAAPLLLAATPAHATSPKEAVEDIRQVNLLIGVNTDAVAAKGTQGRERAGGGSFTDFSEREK